MSVKVGVTKIRIKNDGVTQRSKFKLEFGIIKWPVMKDIASKYLIVK